MTAVATFTSAMLSCNRTIDDLDEIAGSFLEAERRASKAYADAHFADQLHEDLKLQLLGLTMGSEYEPKTVYLHKYHLDLKFARTALIDAEAVVRFRLALIRDGSWKGLLKEIFEGRMVYTLRSGAEQILAHAQLSDRLRPLYEQCWTESRTPILEVRRRETNG